jgi:ureidoacrylate peracid hydrolase
MDLLQDEDDGLPMRAEIRARVLARRGRLHLYDRLDPARIALVVIDMQETFCAKGAPAEVPLARTLADPINGLTEGLRARGVPVIWVLHANTQAGGHSDWETFFGQFVGGDVRERTIESLSPGRQSVWSELARGNDDLTIVKNRYSALISGASSLERLLRSRGIDSLLIAGTKTDVCCESTARDAMMLDFRVVMVADCCAALSEEEHRDALETIIQQFGDVMNGEDVLRLLDAGAAQSSLMAG